MADSEVVRISFFLSGAPTLEGSAWRLPGEPGYRPEIWARAGDVFDHLMRADGSGEVHVALSVLAVADDHAVVSGDMPAWMGDGDILTGERRRGR